MAIVPARIDPGDGGARPRASRAARRTARDRRRLLRRVFRRRRELYVNEIAPRVHNSGHYSLDATQISQYEAHVRAICDLPLVEPRLLAPAVMVNILGGGSGDRLDGVRELLRDPNLKLHLYGKRHAALRRKMGHFTIVAAALDEALARARAAQRILSWHRRAEPVEV